MKEWYLVDELVGKPGMPKTNQGVNLRARKEKWEKRKPSGVKGRAFEYQIKCLPIETQEALMDTNHKLPLQDQTQKQTTITIPEYDVHASAGGGSIVDCENKINEFEFPESWLRKLGLYGFKLCVIKAYGDSMESSISNGDPLLVKLVDFDYGTIFDGVHVINVDGGLMVKRLMYDIAAQGYHIVSDNSAYKSFFISKQEFDGRVKVIGHVAGTLFKPIPLFHPSANDEMEMVV